MDGLVGHRPNESLNSKEKPELGKIWRPSDVSTQHVEENARLYTATGSLGFGGKSQNIVSGITMIAGSFVV
jgi:hypothetical protein